MNAIPKLARAAGAALLVAVMAQPQQRPDADARIPGPAVITDSAALWRQSPGELRGGGSLYRASFDEYGMRFEPALGRECPTVQHLALRPLSVRRGAGTVVELPSQATVERAEVDHVARYRHATGITERYQLTAKHVELSWRFDARPAGAGDLVVRYAVDTSFADATADGDGLRFEGECGHVTIGAVTGVDALGARVAGKVRFEHGALQLSLPGAFVDAASYPMVLDPIISPPSNIFYGVGSATSGVDVAYDRADDNWLAVYSRYWSSTAADLRGQIVSTDGQPIGSWFTIAAGDLDLPARVAYLATRDRFGVTYRDRDPNTQARRVRFAGITGAAVTHTLTADYGGNYQAPDIGCDTNAPIGSARGFVIAYHDTQADAIRARRVYFSPNDQLVSPPATTLWSDGALLGPWYSEVAISRGAASSNDLLVAVRYQSGIGPSFGVKVRTIDSATGATGPSTTLFLTTTGDVTHPSVDGYNGRWVVGWNDWTTLSSILATRVVRQDPNGPGFVLEPTTYPLNNTHHTNLELGYTPGRTWMTYRTSGQLDVEAIDSGTSETCSDSYTQLDPLVESTVATSTASGASARELAMAAWVDSPDVYVLPLRNHGAGTVVSLGGGCGNGGDQTISHDAGIGSSGIVCRVDNLPPTAIGTVFNFSPTVPPFVCGSCEWIPFHVTAFPPIVAGSAQVQFPIPCRLALIGSQFETQFTTVDLTQPGCIVQGIALSDRWSMTLGN